MLTEKVFHPIRDPNGPFLFSVDHCFAIRGQGTVLTGTILNGSAAVNEVGMFFFTFCGLICHFIADDRNSYFKNL